MEAAEIKKIKQQTLKAIEGKRIKDALALIGSSLKILQDGDMIDSHYNLEITYKSILHYTTEGSDDPDRQKVYNHLIQNIYELTDRSTDMLLLKYSGEYLYDVKRNVIRQNLKLDQQRLNNFIQQCEDIKLKSLVSDTEKLSTDFIQSEATIFNLIWVGNHNTQETSIIKSIFESGEIPDHSKSLFISAILLNLLRIYNLNLILILFDLSTDSVNYSIQMKALTALIIILSYYDNRIALYPEITQRLQLLKDNEQLTNFIQTVIIQIIRTKETERISQKLQNEIIPEVVKMQPDLKDKLDLDNLTTGNPEDKNPEWTDFFSDSPELISKLEEISKWQMEGADVFLSTFQMLKHFPFFNHFQNWFNPFYLNHPQVSEAIKESGKLFVKSDLIENISESGFLCNSDKYSLILSIPHMPSFQRDMMGQMFKAELEQMGEIEKDQFTLDPTKKKLVISNQYIQDLYRFFKVHPLKRQFDDIFDWEMDFYNKYFFSQLFSNIEPVRQIGEFFFQKNYINEALELFKKLSLLQPENVELIQKMAYCYQQINDYENALVLYKKADILNPDNKWTLKKIALCHRYQNQTEEALKYYLSVSKIDPDNLHTQASIGGCYLELGNFEEALKYYFKVEYLDSENTKVWRPIGWCSLVLGKFEQAEKYYQKVLISEQNKHDLINIGHIQLCKGNRKEAIQYYLKCLHSPDISMDEFIKLFDQDLKYIKKHGIDENDIPILLDQLRYSLEQ